MIALFSARVCLGHLSRVDDAIQCAWWAGLRRSFAAEVLKTSAKPQQLAQALQLTGVAQLLQARAAAFYSKRAPFLVGDVWACEAQARAVRYLEEAEAYEVGANPLVEYNLALSYAESNEAEKALAKVDALAAAEPFFSPLWPLRALLSYAVEGYDGCVRVLEEAKAVLGDTAELQWVCEGGVRRRVVRCKVESCEHAFEEVKGLLISSRFREGGLTAGRAGGRAMRAGWGGGERGGGARGDRRQAWGVGVTCREQPRGGGPDVRVPAVRGERTERRGGADPAERGGGAERLDRDAGAGVERGGSGVAA